MKKAILLTGAVAVPLVAAGVVVSNLVKGCNKKGENDKKNLKDDMDEELDDGVNVGRETVNVEHVEPSEQNFNFGVAKKDNLDAEFNKIKYSINYEDYSEKNEFIDSDVVEILEYLKSSDEFASYTYPHINNYIIPLINVFQPKSYDELKNVIAIGFGTGTWDDGGKMVLCDKKTDLSGLITYRESISNYLLKQGLVEDEINSIVSNIEYGRVNQGKSEKWHTDWKLHMLDNNVPEWYIWLCEQIAYLIDETAAEYYTNLFLSKLIVSKYNNEVDLYEIEESIEEDA